MIYSLIGNTHTAWHVINFRNDDQAQFIAGMNFTDELYSAYVSTPFPPDNVQYFYKHTDTDSVYYLPPELSNISHNVLNKYGAVLMIDEPDVSGYEHHVF